MPPSRPARLVRKRPLSERIQSWLNPLDHYLWLSEEIATFDWDSNGFGTRFGAAANFIFLLARANSAGREDVDDVFSDAPSGGWVTYLVSFSPFRAYISVICEIWGSLCSLIILNRPIPSSGSSSPHPSSTHGTPLQARASTDFSRPTWNPKAPRPRPPTVSGSTPPHLLRPLSGSCRTCLGTSRLNLERIPTRAVTCGRSRSGTPIPPLCASSASSAPVMSSSIGSSCPSPVWTHAPASPCSSALSCNSSSLPSFGSSSRVSPSKPVTRPSSRRRFYTSMTPNMSIRDCTPWSGRLGPKYPWTRTITSSKKPWPSALLRL